MTIATMISDARLDELKQLRVTLQRKKEEHIAYRQHRVMMERAQKRGQSFAGRNEVLIPKRGVIT